MQVVNNPAASLKRSSIPPPAQVGFTLWMLFWVPVVLVTQGPQNFWWLCNLAQFILLYSVWTSNRLLISSQAGTIVVVGAAWTVDLVAALISGSSPFGITTYMFNEQLSAALRVTSTYHVWLPVFVLWLCRRQGYDDRGFWLQCVIGTVAILGSWVFGDAARNLNYTIAPFGIQQTWLPQALYIPVLCAGTALLLYLPGHFITRTFAGEARSRSDNA